MSGNRLEKSSYDIQSIRYIHPTINGEIPYCNNTINRVIPIISNNPVSEEGKNHTPMTKTTAYKRPNKAVIASPEATFNPIIFHLLIKFIFF